MKKISSITGMDENQTNELERGLLVNVIQNMTFFLHYDWFYFYNGHFFEILRGQNLNKLLVPNLGVAFSCKKIVELLLENPCLVSQSVKFDKNILAFKNILYNVMTGEFQLPTPSYFVTSYININYIDGLNINCPKFDSFVNRISGGNENLITLIWQSIAYIISNDMNAKKIIVYQSDSGRASDILCKFISSLFPVEAISAVSISSFDSRFSTYELIGKKINVSSNLEAIYKESINIIEILTENAPILAEGQCLPKFHFLNLCKFVFSEKNDINLNDKEINKKLLIIKLNDINTDYCQADILTSFEGEKQSIIMKALLYYRQLVKNNYDFSINM